MRTRVASLVSGSLIAVSACATPARTAPPPARTATAAASGAPSAAPCPAASASAAPDARAATIPSADDLARAVIARFDAHDAGGVVALFTPSMARAFPVEKTAPIVESTLAENGKLLEATFVGNDDDWRVYRVTAERGELRLLLSAENGKIAGIRITAPPKPPPPIARSTIPLALPFRGEWRVDRDDHGPNPSQRRAVDLVKPGPDGATHHGDGHANADYFAYGQEVLAAADGVVTTVIDGVWENEPGKMNGYAATGNLVVLDHGSGVWSAYAHLQPGKTRVRVGAKVRRGDVLGLCGNSGNSSEPHLHFQLQDGPRFDASWGVEPVFAHVRVTRDGRTEVADGYSFRKDDRVAPP